MGDRGISMTFSHPLARGAAIFTANDSDGNKHHVLAVVTTLELDAEHHNYKKPLTRVFYSPLPGSSRARLGGHRPRRGAKARNEGVARPATCARIRAGVGCIPSGRITSPSRWRVSR